MKSPEQIRDMEFQKSTMGGYKQSDVELFLEEVASQIEILMRQKADLERKLQEVSRKAPEAALSTAGIQSVLVNAQRVADEVVENAKAEAETIAAEAKLKLSEAEIESRNILAEAEKKAVLLGDTAEKEAAKIIAAAAEEAKIIVAEAKESIELEQKLYDRMKIEISDFRKKASQQCSALVELINQLPGEIPFNIERSKTVLSVDFSDPEALLKAAVEERLQKEAPAAEESLEVQPEAVAEVPDEEPIAEPTVTVVHTAEEDDEPIMVQISVEPEAESEEEPIVKAPDTEFSDDEQLSFDTSALGFAVAEPEEDEDEVIPFKVAADESDEPKAKKGRISFDDDDDEDDDDEDDEPRLFFRRKKK